MERVPLSLLTRLVVDSCFESLVELQAELALLPSSQDAAARDGGGAISPNKDDPAVIAAAATRRVSSESGTRSISPRLR
jgi:hypothetical protein